MPRSNNSYRKRYHHNAPSCLYIGAGWDMSPVAKLPRVQHFILIDSLPEHQIYAPHEPEWQFTHTACALADKIHRELQQAALVPFRRPIPGLHCMSGTSETAQRSATT